MPIAITRDDAQRRLTVAVSDPWSVEEIAVAGDRQVAQHLWRYGTLYDLRGSAWVPSEPDLLWLVKRGQQQVAVHGARGPVAILIDPSSAVDVARRYAQYGGATGHEGACIFTDEADAVGWLAAQPVAG
ncbi:MAG: hypothetical protein AB7H96_08030 [Vicinamibacterales bacterium]